MSDENRAYPKAKSGQPLALEQRGDTPDGRRYSPSIARNRDVVREVFLQNMPHEGVVLEVASGTGEHGAHIASAALGLTWIYSDIDPDGRTSQAAWKAHSTEAAGLEGPLDLDVTQPDWTPAGVPANLDGLFCANMIHIAPFIAAEGLLSGAGRHLRSGGRFMLYGPFGRDGQMAPSNAKFSADLKRRDPAWGVRDLERDILPLASNAGLSPIAVIDMPANNLSVIFEAA